MSRKDMDRLFKEKLEGRKVPFNEDAWHDAEKLIEKSERGRGKILLWTSIVILFLSGVFYFTYQELSGLRTSDNIIKQEENKGTTINKDHPLKENPSRNVLSKDLKGAFQTSFGNIDSNTSENEIANAGNSKLFGKKSNSRGLHPNNQRNKNTQSKDVQNTTPYSSGNNGKSGELVGGFTKNIASKKMAKVNNSHLKENLKKFPLIESLLNLSLDAPVAVNKTLKDDNTKPIHSGQRKFEFGCVGGVQVSQRYKNDKNSGMAFSPVAGIYFRYFVFKGVSLNSELLYQYSSGITVDTSVESTEYDFGYQQHTTKYVSKGMHYLEWPVYFDIPLFGRQGITAGVQADYLINVLSDVTEINSSSLSNTTQSTRKEYGYKQGLNDLDFQILIGYRFDFNEKLKLQFRSYYGLTDVTKNEYFGNARASKNLGVKIMLQYKLY